MSQHIAVQRVERWIVDVGREHAFAQVVEHDHSRCSTEPPKSPLVQLSPGLSTGPEHQQPNRFAAEAQVNTNSRVRRYLALCGSRTMGPVP
jgi:hypothetical protein